jgi:ferredoxin
MRLILDPIACEAHGLCAELLPEAIAVDDWGYPIIADGELPASLERLARRAAKACPTLALRIQAAATLGEGSRARSISESRPRTGRAARPQSPGR